MGAILNILIPTITLLFSLYLASAALWHIFDARVIIAFLLIILLLAIWKEILDIKKRNYKTEKEKYEKRRDGFYFQLVEKQELRSKGVSEERIIEFGENPVLKHSFEIAHKYLKENNFKRALEELKECLTHPETDSTQKVAVKFLMGLCYQNLSELKSALNIYSEVLILSKSINEEEDRIQILFPIFIFRGITRAKLGIYKKARIDFKNAIKLKPDFDEAWYYKGIVLSNLGRHEEALKANKKAIELKPDYSIAWRSRGFILRNLDRRQEALKAFEKVIELRPDDAGAWVDRGGYVKQT